MKTQYEDIVKSVCKVGNWKKPYSAPGNLSDEEKKQVMEASIAERQGAVGVACVIAYINGTQPDEQSLSKAISVPIHEVDKPYKRLSVNGVFSTRFDAKNDEVLAGSAGTIYMKDDGRQLFSGKERTRNAWCNIAGIASGFCGLREI